MYSDLPPDLNHLILARTDASSSRLALLLVAKSIQASRQSGVALDIALAASFDLLVASKYYQYVLPEGWLWCQHCDHDIYTFFNACPYCITEERFVHHIGCKPTSGQIGPATAEALREILSAYYHQTAGSSVAVHTGSEPIDIAIVDTVSRYVFIAEVKAAPLFIPALARKHTAQGLQTTEQKPLRHSVGIVRAMDQHSYSLVIPAPDGINLFWKLQTTGLGWASWGQEAIANAIETGSFDFAAYVRTWSHLWQLYTTKNNRDKLFWFTGACGLPRRPGEGWPVAADGKPKGTISDGKTSVGMDRTDDIKKSTFQVLKLGIEARRLPMKTWTLGIGLASNLHAARHYEDYLKQYEEIVWGWSKHGGQSPKYVFNLFDGIISFSQSNIRDQKLTTLVTWH